MIGKKLSLILFLLLTVCSISPVFGSSYLSLTSKNGKNTLNLTINSAYYTNIDNDDVLDVVALFEISFSNERSHRFILTTILELPSGHQYLYSWFITSKLSLNEYRLELHDHAIEAGDYSLMIHIQLFTGGMTTGSVEYSFDPPGGSGGGTPIAYLF
jgi:hypothetical protein